MPHRAPNPPLQPHQIEPPTSPKPLHEDIHMLDVHPPHASVHTWRDFFIHIATIVIGLCIAVGIEQTVEALHHRHQVRDAREDLRRERDENRRLFVRYVQDFHWETAALENNMLVFEYLQQHPGTPQEKLPGLLSWRWGRSNFTSAVWDTAQQTSVTSLMPPKEVTETARLYENLRRTTASDDETWIAVNNARRYLFRDYDPSHLTPSQVAEEIELVKTALMKHYAHGLIMSHFPALFADFPFPISEADLSQIPHDPDAQTLEKLSTARALTNERLKAAGYAPRRLTPDGWTPIVPVPEKK
jgi:hypothetical protein